MPGAPDIASVAAVIGDAARSRMLLALMGGRALTASELSLEADVAPSTASSHLARLLEAELVRVERQGRHRYFAIANEAVAEVVERLGGLAQRGDDSCVRTGPRDPALRRARVCYDHLAGDLGVALYDALVRQHWLALASDGIAITSAGERGVAALGLDVAALGRARRLLCRPCLDWSVRRHHLAGALGAALLAEVMRRRWARRDPVTRALHFSETGERTFARAFGIPARGSQAA